MFYETISDNLENFSRVLRFFIYTIMKDSVCIDYITCQSKKLSKIPVGYAGGYKHGDKSYEKLGYWNSRFLTNLMSCHGFLKKINYVVIINVLKEC